MLGGLWIIHWDTGNVNLDNFNYFCYINLLEGYAPRQFKNITKPGESGKPRRAKMKKFTSTIFTVLIIATATVALTLSKELCSPAFVAIILAYFLGGMAESFFMDKLATWMQKKKISMFWFILLTAAPGVALIATTCIFFEGAHTLVLNLSLVAGLETASLILRIKTRLSNPSPPDSGQAHS